jgi:UDP-glucose 4-epimerase
MKIVVTGATGFVGANLVKAFSQKEHEVTACLLPGDAQEPKLDGMACIKKYLDILDADGMADVIRGADAVVHTAAVQEGLMGVVPLPKFLDINVKGTLSVLEGIQKSGCGARLIAYSSCSVYDALTGNRTPIQETDELKPSTFYGLTKILGENLVRHYCRQHDIPYTILRPNAIFGGHEIWRSHRCRSVLKFLSALASYKQGQLYAAENPEGWTKQADFLKENAEALCLPITPNGESWRAHRLDVRDMVRLTEVGFHA